MEEDKNKKRKDKNSSKSDNRFSGYGYDDEEEEVYVAKSNLLPIHLLLFNRKAPLDVVKAVVEAYPNGLSEKDSYGRTPLHIAIVEGCNASVVKFILSRNPGMASEKDFNGEIPLHNVLQIWSLMTNNGDSEILSVIHALVEAYPKGINDSNIDGMTPMRIVKMMEVMDDGNTGDGNKFHLLHFLEGKESELSAEKRVVFSTDTDLVVDELLSKVCDES